MDKNSSKEKTDLYPDIENCRVVDVGLEGYAECSCYGPNPCVFALPFGYGYLCKHPQLEEILSRSRNVEKSNHPVV